MTAQRLPASAPGAALWSSGFRPFFLLGASYGPLVMLAWALAFVGVWPVEPRLLRLGHAHELVFGFAAAMVCGVVLTALPGWTGSAELRGPRLAALVALWLAGRVVWWATLGGARWLPSGLALLLDSALMPVLCLLLWPTLARARRTLFWWTLLPLLGLALGNLLVHRALASGSAADARFGITLGVYALTFVYSLYVGMLAPAFTRNWLRLGGQRVGGAVWLPLEWATAAAMVLLAASDLLHAGEIWIALAAALACGLHGWRWARWRGWRTAPEPLLWTLHVGYCFLIAAIALRGVSALSVRVPPDAWVHLFTLGALGMTKLGLMTRVVLRHTGRPMRVPVLMKLAYAMMLAATLLRLAYSVHQLGAGVLLLSAALWAGAFALYLLCFADALLRPSLARASPP